MYEMIMSLLSFFGFATIPTTFPEFLLWFVAALFGIEIVLFVVDALFYTVRSVGRSLK